MKLISNSIKDGEPIPGEIAFAPIDPKNHIAISTNRNPHLEWSDVSDVPAGTKSFALICHDYDVPSQLKDVNQEGREVLESLRRDIFFQATMAPAHRGMTPYRTITSSLSMSLT